MHAQRIGSRITITVELAAAIGRIAETFKSNDNVAIRVEYREDEPENVWHIIAVKAAGDDIDYTVDDETGLFMWGPDA